VNEHVYGLLAEFDSPEQILAAAERARAAGYADMDAYSPFPVEGLSEALGVKKTRLPQLVFCGGLTGGTLGYLMQYFAAVVDYPINVGGRPFHSWIAFVPITFECTVLLAALTTVIGMLALNGLPRPHHPLFSSPRFVLASRSRFFLCIEAKDPLFDRERTRQFLESTHPAQVVEVEE
jgi:hypothetical protein